MGDPKCLPVIAGFGLRVSARRSPFRVWRADGSSALELACVSEHGQASCRIDPATDLAVAQDPDADRDRQEAPGSDLALIEHGPPRAQWWIEMPTYRVVLPARSILVASATPDAFPPF